MRLCAIVCTVLAAACCPPPQKPEVVVEVVPYECGSEPSLERVTILPVEWRVLPGPDGDQLFTLTARDYQNLATNTANLKASAKQLRVQRDFYRECVAASKAVDSRAKTPAVDKGKAPE